MTNKDKLNNKKHTVKILGEELTITGKISKKYVNKLVSYINQVGNEINQAYPNLPRRRLINLALINITHKFFELEDKQNEIKLEKKEIKKENKQLEKENKQLKEQLESLKQDYEELSVLLEEVDG